LEGTCRVVYKPAKAIKAFSSSAQKKNPFSVFSLATAESNRVCERGTELKLFFYPEAEEERREGEQVLLTLAGRKANNYI
jgi:hypothetical protein